MRINADKGKHPGGAPSKLTNAVADLIERGVRAGLPFNAACDLAGISKQTFFNWMERGEVETSGLYFEFFDRIKRARAETQLEALKIVRAGGFGWQASAWYLERCHATHYGRSTR